LDHNRQVLAAGMTAIPAVRTKNSIAWMPFARAPAVRPAAAVTWTFPNNGVTYQLQNRRG